MSQLCITTTGRPYLAATAAISPGSFSYCNPQISLSRCTPSLAAYSAVSALNVSTDTGTGHFLTICGKNCDKIAISSLAPTGTKPGREDSAPISIISAPSFTISSICAKALSTVFHLPPSEKESLVTFKIPMTKVFLPMINSFPSDH